jgi:hypothetical protein
MRTESIFALITLTSIFLIADPLARGAALAQEDEDLPTIRFLGPIDTPPTCSVVPESVPLNTNTRNIHCPIGHSGGFEARRDTEARDFGGNGKYKANTTLYLDCQIKAECQGIAPITRLTVCHVTTCQ